MDHRHQEIDKWLQVSLDVLDSYDEMFGSTPIDNDILEAVQSGRMTPEEAEQCRQDYINGDD